MCLCSNLYTDRTHCSEVLSKVVAGRLFYWLTRSTPFDKNGYQRCVLKLNSGEGVLANLTIGSLGSQQLANLTTGSLGSQQLAHLNNGSLGSQELATLD